MFQTKEQTSHLFNHTDLSQFSYSRLNSANEHNHTKAIPHSSLLFSFAPFPALSKPLEAGYAGGEEEQHWNYTQLIKNTIFSSSLASTFSLFQPLNQLCLSQVQRIVHQGQLLLRVQVHLHTHSPTKGHLHTSLQPYTQHNAQEETDIQHKMLTDKEKRPAVDKTRKDLFGTHSCHVMSL